jgi:PadR family transcriptional regulator, regulatory protein PadR
MIGCAPRASVLNFALRNHDRQRWVAEERLTGSGRQIQHIGSAEIAGGIVFEIRSPSTYLLTDLLFSQWKRVILPVGNPIGNMKEKTDVLQGTLALMALKTLDVLGPLHGYGIARRIEQISGELLTVNQGTLYPVLLKLEQEGSIASEWGASENNRKARFYRLTRDGRKQLQAETRGWEQTAAIIGRFFAVKAEDLE